MPPARSTDYSTFAQDGLKQTRVRVIDVHAHWYPPEWLALMEKEGDANGAKMSRNARGQLVATIPGLSVVFQDQYTNIKTRLASMDKAGVAMHALSLTQPMAFWAPPAFGLKLCQTYNDACDALHAQHPDRFVGLAMVPMQDPALAVQEIDRVAKLKGIRGLYMATHINGKNLDQKEFWPVYRARRSAACRSSCIRSIRSAPSACANITCATSSAIRPSSALAAASFIFSGAFDDFPKLVVVLPHSGGVFPQLIGRWDHGASVRPETKHLKNPPSHYLRRFYYDTVAHSRADSDESRAPGRAPTASSCGTDFPADMSVTDVVGTVEKLTELPTKDRDLILRGNAARLLEARRVDDLRAAPG